MRKSLSNFARARYGELRDLAKVRRHRFQVSRKPPPPPDAIIAILVARNEMQRLAAWLDHYRALGVTRFVIFDNASSDGSGEFLRRQNDVDLFSVQGDWADTEGGLAWATRVPWLYGFNRWYIFVDADEHLVYDGMEGHGLTNLAERLTALGSKALYAPMIDMYAREPGAEYRTDEAPERSFPYFDGSSYTRKSVGKRWKIVGGPRIRLASDPSFFHSLCKYPFFFWDSTVYRRYIHHFSAARHRATLSGALLHFKFTADFQQRIEVVLTESRHAAYTYDHRHYQQAMRDGGLANPFYEQSLRYEGPHSLIKAGLMDAIGWEDKCGSL